MRISTKIAQVAMLFDIQISQDDDGQFVANMRHKTKGDSHSVSGKNIGEIAGKMHVIFKKTLKGQL